MMSKMKEKTLCTRIVSEPGDNTRYDYIYIQTDLDDYSFMPYGNTISYPQRLNYYEALSVFESHKSGEEEDLFRLARKKDCNPYTLLECIRTVIEDHDGLGNH